MGLTLLKVWVDESECLLRSMSLVLPRSTPFLGVEDRTRIPYSGTDLDELMSLAELYLEHWPGLSCNRLLPDLQQSL